MEPNTLLSLHSDVFYFNRVHVKLNLVLLLLLSDYSQNLFIRFIASYRNILIVQLPLISVPTKYKINHIQDGKGSRGPSAVVSHCGVLHLNSERCSRRTLTYTYARFVSVLHFSSAMSPLRNSCTRERTECLPYAKQMFKKNRRK